MFLSRALLLSCLNIQWLILQLWGLYKIGKNSRFGIYRHHFRIYPHNKQAKHFTFSRNVWLVLSLHYNHSNNTTIIPLPITLSENIICTYFWVDTVDKAQSTLYQIDCINKVRWQTLTKVVTFGKIKKVGANRWQITNYLSIYSFRKKKKIIYCITRTFTQPSLPDLRLSPLSTLSTLKYMPFSIREKHIALLSSSLMGQIIIRIGWKSFIFLQNPMISYIFPCLTSCESYSPPVTLQEKRIMVTRRFINEIEPEQTYSISRAARYLGVHRCTIYAYINHPVCPLPFIKVTETGKLMFNGSDLIAYKTAGLPKRGRKRKSGIS